MHVYDIIMIFDLGVLGVFGGVVSAALTCLRTIQVLDTTLEPGSTQLYGPNH